MFSSPPISRSSSISTPTFVRCALTAPHRADQLCRWASLARANIHRLRSKQAHLRQMTLPNHLHNEL